MLEALRGKSCRVYDEACDAVLHAHLSEDAQSDVRAKKLVCHIVFGSLGF
jgi:hypothetical protein